MQIKIASHLRPFTHTPGGVFILPGTLLQFTIFPTLIKIQDLSKKNLITEIPLRIQGPVKDFTIQQDLEKKTISVWGQSSSGYFRYRLTSQEDFLNIEIIKEPNKEIPILEDIPKISCPCFSYQNEKLSLGSHKSQDWDLLLRRLDATEILPLWFHLGQNTWPHFISLESDSLLSQCKKKIENKETLSIITAFMDLFKAGFYKGLNPRLLDLDFQGFSLTPLPEKIDNLLPLLNQTSTWIRSIFLQQDSNLVKLLPCLPPELHAGRFLNLKLENLGTLDIEWTKKQIQRAVFRCEESGTLNLIFPKGISHFRLRTNNKDRGQIISCGTSICVNKKTVYWFDHFQS